MKDKNRYGIGKIPAVSCMLCVLFVSFSAVLTVNAESNAKLITAAVTAGREETAAVTFTLEGNPGIWGLKIKVNYDHSVLTLQSVTNGSIFENNDITLPSSFAREQFVFVAASNEMEDAVGDGSLVTLNFLVEKDAAAETYPITAEVTQAINFAGEDVKIDVESGSVTVNAVDKPSGSLTFEKVELPKTQPAERAEHAEQAEAELREMEIIALAVGNAKTGDAGNPVLWIVLIVIALAGGGACCYALYIRRRRRDVDSRGQ